MQTLFLGGRWISRALMNSFHTHSEMHQRQLPKETTLQLVTASCGYDRKKLESAIRVLDPPTIGKMGIGFGDDSFFIEKHRDADVIGVADGVGGWRTYGVDPSWFSRTLMHTCANVVKQGRFSPIDPTESILKQSYEELNHHKLQLPGSSTACIISLSRRDDTIYTCNLGDSGFMVVRDGRIVHRSQEQQHYFNTPFQLALVPPSQQGQVISDSTESALASSFKVQTGDTILMGTDGLFDNLYEEMILKHLNRVSSAAAPDVLTVAQDLVSHAATLSVRHDYVSPFAVNARRNGLHFIGGKPDDITVLLSKVTHSYYDQF